ncbi:GspH/FimT family pseudopilin [Pseudomonas syringae]|uniref:Type II secretion system protein H n=1 Tax=Pseudomonas syringae TaxID=317 RepID=A0A085VMS8_PSESX|nr:GspH/FimT family pseudopilin [Pseudomonas syringae]KFE56741.1 general secretion pathway protein GspH [Pseudomonas syringae]
MTRRAKGFTLIELLITVTLVGILAAIAVPNFSSMIQKSKADSEVSDLQRALNFTRLEAINRGVNMTVLPSTGATWTTELKVVLSSDTTTAIRVVAPMSSGAKVAMATTGGTSVSALQFNNLGGLSAPAEAVVMTYTLGSNVRTLNIGLNGRIQ